MAQLSGSQVVVTSAARTTSGNQAVTTSPLRFAGGTLVLGVACSAASGTTPSLAVTVEWSHDGGTTWFVGDPADAFTALTATANVTKTFTAKANTYRVVWTITGTTPSFTFSVYEQVIA